VGSSLDLASKYKYRTSGAGYSVTYAFEPFEAAEDLSSCAHAGGGYGYGSAEAAERYNLSCTRNDYIRRSSPKTRSCAATVVGYGLILCSSLPSNKSH
jgi:hypothetical protein